MHDTRKDKGTAFSYVLDKGITIGMIDFDRLTRQLSIPTDAIPFLIRALQYNSEDSLLAAFVHANFRRIPWGGGLRYVHRTNEFDPDDKSSLANVTVNSKKTRLDKKAGAGDATCHWTKSDEFTMCHALNTELKGSVLKNLTDPQVKKFLPNRTAQSWLDHCKVLFDGCSSIKKILKLKKFQLILQEGMKKNAAITNKTEETVATATDVDAVTNEMEETVMNATGVDAVKGIKVQDDTKAPAVAKKSRKKKTKKGAASDKENDGVALELTGSNRKSSATTKKRNSSSSNAPAERKENAGKAKANIEVLGDEFESECVSKYVSPSKKFRSSGEFNIKCMHNNASEDEKDPYVPSDYESDDDESLN